MDILDPAAQFSRLVLWIVATCWSELEPILLPGTGWEGATIVIDNLVLCKTFFKRDADDVFCGGWMFYVFQSDHLFTFILSNQDCGRSCKGAGTS